WIGPRTANSAISPTIRRTARAFIRTAGALSIAVEGDSVQLHAMVDEAVAELLGDPFLQRFELIIDELDDVAGLDVDQVIVMAFRSRFVTRAPVAELVPFEDPGLLKQPHRAIDRRDRDVRI